MPKGEWYNDLELRANASKVRGEKDVKPGTRERHAAPGHPAFACPSWTYSNHLLWGRDHVKGRQGCVEMTPHSALSSRRDCVIHSATASSVSRPDFSASPLICSFHHRVIIHKIPQKGLKLLYQYNFMICRRVHKSGWCSNPHHPLFCLPGKCR